MERHAPAIEVSGLCKTHGAVQRHVGAAVAKTVNLPAESTTADG